MLPKRRIHLGIDYGTSTSKIVFRDYGAPGAEIAFVVVRNGSFRIPSTVCATAAEFVFGDDRSSAEQCDIYESLKMRIAAEVTDNPKFYFGPWNTLPNGFTARDLGVLTVWFLISEGRSAIADYLGHPEAVSIGMTIGVPMAFYKDARLRSSFLAIARQAWSLYRSEGRLRSPLLVERAKRLLEKHRNSAEITVPEYEVRDWLRSEAEAAMWWPFQSPAISDGPYAKVDIGAGTTHASLFRISRHFRGIQPSLAFFGAVSEPVGMDAVDRVIAESQNLGGDCLALRGLEENILQSNGRACRALVPIQEEIYEAYRKAWIETYRKIEGSHAERKAWQEHRVFVIGGGSLVSKLVEKVAVHPGRHRPLQLAPLEQPSDLVFPNGERVPKNDLPFVTVAYGLSNIGLSIPEAFAPDQIPPLPDMGERRARLDRDDIYAK